MSVRDAADKIEAEWYMNMRPTHHASKELGVEGDLSRLIELLDSLDPYDEEAHG